MSTQNAEPVPVVDVQREARRGVVFGGMAMLALVVLLAALPLAASDSVQADGEGNDLSFLRTVGLGGTGQLMANLMRVAHGVLLIPFAFFLIWAVRGRNPEAPRWLPWLCVVGVAIASVSTLLGFFEVRDAAREFVASGPQTLERAEEFRKEIRDMGSVRAANLMAFGGALFFGIWVSLTSFELMRVGMVTRFLGLFGLGAGLTTAISFPVGQALFFGWLGSIALLSIGYWPGGRPRAWEEGRAFSWDAPEGQMPPRAEGGAA